MLSVIYYVIIDMTNAKLAVEENNQKTLFIPITRKVIAVLYSLNVMPMAVWCNCPSKLLTVIWIWQASN